VDEILGRGGEIVCRPWVAYNGKAFSKAAFKLNMHARPHDHLSGWRAGTHSILGGRVRSLRVRSMSVAHEVHECRDGKWTYREHCRGRSPTTAALEVPRYPTRARAPARTRGSRSQACPPRPPTGSARPLPRHPQEPLRPTPCLGRPTGLQIHRQGVPARTSFRGYLAYNFFTTLMRTSSK